VLGRRRSGIFGARPFARVGAAAFLALFAHAAAAPAADAAPDPGRTASAAFSLGASNGFTLDVESRGAAVTVVASERRPPVATFSRAGAPRPASSDNGAASIYYARGASAQPGDIEARLGRLGQISVSFRPSGRSRVTTLAPGAAGLACGRPIRIVRRLGAFVGRIEFSGEDGYTEVLAARARGSVGTPLPRDCGDSSRLLSRTAATPRHPLLRAVDHRAGTRFEARTSGAGVAFVATWRERLEDGLVVSRRAYAGAPRSAFGFDRQLRTARVTPPAPFSGTARYSAAAGAEDPAVWSGSLSATFPGVAVPMTGPGFRARLEAAR
jgi:hypothetical protein